MQFEEKDILNLVVLTRENYEELVKIKAKFTFLRELYETGKFVPDDMIRVIVECGKGEKKA